MIAVRGGEFPFGDDGHRIAVADFSMATTLVAKGVWAKLFLERLGEPYRLPSEAEWEYAERGGVHWHDGVEWPQ